MMWSRRVKKDEIRADQKWDFISLNDFKSTSCFTPFAYGYLLVSLVISVAVYAVDIFTAVNLLAFNRWSGEIKPIIPLDISKWIFSACIMASLVNLAFEHLRAWHVMRRGAVAESYLDSLAVRLECIRMGESGRGWRRFLVFAELTKGRKGAEFVALFTYFSFQAWIRVIICQGPQKVINALTLWSVFKANLDPSSAKNIGQGFIQFFQKIGILASQNHQQAVILSGMLFTLVIWVFSFLSLILAVLFFVFFLWHYIPNADGGLSGYCERKINTRLAEIVSVKVNKALEEEERKRRKADQKALRNGEKPAFGRQATLPTLFDAKDDKLPNMPMLNRNDTTPTLPLYSSRPGTPSSALPAFEMDDLDKRRPYASRTGTGNSYTSNAPLLSNASDMGYDHTASPISPLPPLNTNGMPMAPQRTMTNNSAASWNANSPMGAPLGPQRTMTNNSAASWNTNSPMGPPRGPPRMGSGDRGYTQSPVSYTDGRSPQNGRGPFDPYSSTARSSPAPTVPSLGQPSADARTPFDPYSPAARSSPAPTLPSLGQTSTSSRTPFDPYSPAARSSPAPTVPSLGQMNTGARTPFDPYSPAARSSPAPSLGPSSTGEKPAYKAYSPEPTIPSLGPSIPSSDYGRSSPALSVSRSPPPTNNGTTAYTAYNQTSQRPAPSSTPSNSAGLGQPNRSMTDPASRPPPTDYFSSQPPQRSATGFSNAGMNTPGPRPSPAVARMRESPARLASPAPYVNNVNGRSSPHGGYNTGGSNSPSPPRDQSRW